MITVLGKPKNLVCWLTMASEKPRYAPVPHLSVRSQALDLFSCARARACRSTSKASITGNPILFPTLATVGTSRLNSKDFPHALQSFRCEDEYVLVNIVRNNKHLRALSGSVTPKLQVEGMLFELYCRSLVRRVHQRRTAISATVVELR